MYYVTTSVKGRAEIAHRYKSISPAYIDWRAEASYEHFLKEIESQYLMLQYRENIHVVVTEQDPYKDSEEMFQDITDNSRLAVWSGGAPFCPGHPMSQEQNIQFRAVHDYYGHYLRRHPFTLAGELMAFTEHQILMSERAWPALFNETIAQLCYFDAFREHVPVQKCLWWDLEGLRV